MANRIAGITVEIGGDTTKLSTALQLTEEEFLRCQNGISKDEGAEGRGGRRYMLDEESVAKE